MDTYLRSSHNMSGFTLIELLVVSGIIAIVVIASSFGFVDALKKKRDAVRITQVSSIQTSLEFYLAEFGDFSGILSGDGAVCTLCYGQSFEEAVYYSTDLYPLLPGKHSWDKLNTHIAKYSTPIPVDPSNDYVDWLGNGEPDYTNQSLTRGYILVRLRSANVDQPTGCSGQTVSTGYLIETVLENERNSKTDKNREARLFGCIPDGDPREHLFRQWGTLK